MLTVSIDDDGKLAKALLKILSISKISFFIESSIPSNPQLNQFDFELLH